MVSAIASQHRHLPVDQPKAGRPDTGEVFVPGKSVESVGHRAKAMVIETADLDSGAQGRTASKIARMHVTLLSPVPPADEECGE